MVEQKATVRSVIGTVVSNKMHKTIVVEVERKVKHPVYGKYVRKSSRMYAHDDANVCKEGDIVMIKQSRPISKNKHWVLVQVMDKNEQNVTA